jgi:regulator of protease activity HflC (stomatin/prohibitin superfamily)
MDRNSPGPVSYIVGFILLIALLFAFVGGCAWLFSFKGVDSGEVAIVREGGPFDGRAIKEVRQPGSGAKPIGAFNHQETLPVTQRDLTEEAGRIIVPTSDGVNVVVDGQALFQLKTDPNLVKKFYTNFGRRTWDGEKLSEEKGWDNFLKIRLVPILFQSIRQTIGTRDCVSLNNTCIYVLNADAILASTDSKAQNAAQQQAKQVNVSQNLASAEQEISVAFQKNLKAGLGDDYFEGVRFQNLRVGFTSDIQSRVQAAQARRADVAEARLNAQRQQAQAKGDADAKVAAAVGNRQAQEEQAKGVRALAQAYRDNPAQAKIDYAKALCGDDGCPISVVGSSSILNTIPNKGK